MPTAAEPATLGGKARRHLRALGHHLTPVVQVGKEGLSPSLIAAIAQALADHELIKIKLGENADGDRHELAESLATSSGSALVGQIGRTLLLYRRNPKKPKIVLPEEKRAARTTPRALPRKPGGSAKRTR